ncbi:hypothetical protein D0Y65_051462 [Glycine soja]|uniref:Uncharacterized protein n=1 Tax=Glycine soja TaxID=3848 RepID=A0A445FGI5_GLYSO|nr:hypothetical protein D0Y65_051462 [Glycine soja]
MPLLPMTVAHVTVRLPPVKVVVLPTMNLFLLLCHLVLLAPSLLRLFVHPPCCDSSCTLLPLHVAIQGKFLLFLLVSSEGLGFGFGGGLRSSKEAMVLSTFYVTKTVAQSEIAPTSQMETGAGFALSVSGVTLCSSVLVSIVAFMMQ